MQAEDRSTAMTTDKPPTLIHDEDGGAYTLSFVMVMPFLVLLICVVVELSFLLVAKIGTVYASFAGVRAAIVWDSLDDTSSGHSVAEQAAIRAFLPFSSAGFSASSNMADPRLNSYLRDYATRMKELGTNPAAAAYLNAKSAYVSQALAVQLTRAPRGTNPWDEDLTVDVAYDFPFAVPGVGMIFGTRRPGGFVLPIRSRATLPNEVPHNADRKLGIDYGR